MYVPNDTPRGLVYTLADNKLETQVACPAVGAKASMTYNASARSLQIFVDPTHREQYDLAP